MTNRLLSAAAGALVVLAGVSAAQAQDFRALARQDLQAAHDQLRDNHPAAVVPGPASETYRAWLDAGLQEALGMSSRVNSGDSHAYLMRFYAAGFRDPGVQIRPTFDLLGPYFASGWPGVTTGWRDGRYVVTHVQPGVRGVRVGAVVTECNGTPIEEFARRRLDRWEGDLDTEAGRLRTAPYLLWNRNNPFTGGVPGTCKFQEGRGRPRDVELRTQPIQPGQLEAAYRATVYMPGPNPLAIETVNGRPWIHAHSLADDAGWEAFNAQLLGQIDQIRGPQGFVLDLRGAEGQSWNATAKAYAMANRIWTPEFTVPRQPPSGTITFRATQANRDWYADTLMRMEADPLFVQEAAAVIEDTRRIVAAFDEAIAAGQTSFSIQGREPGADSGAPNPVQGQVIVLVDGGCAGGCLDLLDLLTRLPNVRIAGSTTRGATIFVEPTVERLPSGYSDLMYGHKAWVGRQRSGQPYTPAQGLAYTGNPADENAVRTWVAGLFGG